MIKTNKWLLTLFLAPSLLIFMVFIIYPLMTTVYRSFFVYNGFKLGDFIFLENYKAVLQDSVFWNTHWNTLKMLAVQLFVCGPFSYLLALLINERSEKFRRRFKTAVMLPVVLSVTVISLMWKMMMQPDWGLFDVVLKRLGLEQFIIPWLQHEQYSIWIIGFVVLWQYLGFNMLYFYSALRSIPESYYEAARVEGANFFQRAWLISVPMTQEIIKFVLIISITGTMQIFTQIQLMTNGGPGDLTRSIIYQMYYKAFNLMDFGQAGAIAVIFAIETFILIAIVNRFVARDRIEMT